MKLLLFTFVVCFAAALAAPADKQKRDILPGDPRYGTEHHHHHHEHDNEVQISKAAGGYVGSYTVPDDTEGQSLQVQSAYGPPTYKAGKPLGNDYLAPSDTIKNAAHQVPSTSYGIPESTQVVNNNYIGPIIEDKKPVVIKTTLQDVNTDYQVPSVQAPITSYAIKTAIEEQPKFETVYAQKTIVPEVHHEVHQVQQPAVVHKHVETVPQVKTTSVETQGVAQHSVNNLPSLTSSISSFPISSYSSYSSYPISYSSYSHIPVKTVDRHVQVQVPQPYPVPVTKHVAYPVAVPHAVEVPKPYYVRVAQPVQVTVNRPYPVEVPRAVPYLVPHYVRTNVPIVQQHQLTVDTKASNPIESFFENAQSTFQNVFGNFQNPLEGFQNPFGNFELPSSLPSLPSVPSVSSFASQQTQTPFADASVSVNDDSIAIDNPTLKSETTVTKTTVAQPVNAHHAKTSLFKPATTCAGCSVTSSATKQIEYVQPIDANGGYVY